MAANDGDDLLAEADGDVLASKRRARLRLRGDATALAAALVAIAIALAACTGRDAPARPDRSVGHAPPVSVIPARRQPRLRPGPVIPWRPAPPVEQGPMLTVPGCRGTAVRTELTWHALPEEVTGTVRLVNSGAVDCSLPLQAHPPFHLLDERGTPLPVTPPISRPVPPPQPNQVVLRPGGGVIAKVHWFNWCRPTPNAIAIRLPLSASPGPPTGTSAPVAVTPPLCKDPEQTSMLDGDAFALASSAAGVMYGDATSLDQRLEVPRSVRAGARLRYRVTLANRGNWIVPLRPCPNFTATVNLLGPGVEWTTHQKHRFGLRCDVLGGVLRPREQATFELVTTIPANARPSHSLLGWVIEGHDGSSGVEAEFWVSERA
jgi:Protein of unknown function (DUF4232)